MCIDFGDKDPFNCIVEDSGDDLPPLIIIGSEETNPGLWYPRDPSAILAKAALPNCVWKNTSYFSFWINFYINLNIKIVLPYDFHTIIKYINYFKNLDHKCELWTYLTNKFSDDKKL